MDRLRKRLRLEIVLAGVAVALGALTLVFPEWVEALTGWEPDAGSGAAEWIVSGIFLAAALVLAILARRDYRRLAGVRS